MGVDMRACVGGVSMGMGMGMGMGVGMGVGAGMGCAKSDGGWVGGGARGWAIRPLCHNSSVQRATASHATAPRGRLS